MFTAAKVGWIGFDVGAAGVKAAQLVRRNGEFALRTAAIVQRRQRWSAEMLADPEPQSSADECAAAAALCDRLSKAPAASMLPIATCEIVQMNVAASRRAPTQEELLKAVEAETHRAAHERVLDSWPIDAEGRKLNIVSAPQSWSDRIAADVAATGRACRAIDALPWSLARAAGLQADADSSRPVAVLDWGYSRATFCLVIGGAPAHVRILKDCGYEFVLGAVQRELRLDEHDAEVLLSGRGFLSAEPGSPAAAVVDEVLAEPFDRLVQEIRRTLGYWEGLTRGLVPEQILLFGGGGALAGADCRLSAALGSDVQAWRLPFEHPADADALGPACLFGAAAGLSALAWESP